MLYRGEKRAVIACSPATSALVDSVAVPSAPTSPKPSEVSPSKNSIQPSATAGSTVPVSATGDPADDDGGLAATVVVVCSTVTSSAEVPPTNQV